MTRTPTARPAPSTTGPPELPGSAGICIRSSPSTDRSSSSTRLSVSCTRPRELVSEWSSGNPSVPTSSSTRGCSSAKSKRRPSGNGCTDRIRATSRSWSMPTTSPRLTVAAVRSEIEYLSSTTWAAVTTRSSSTMNPVPPPYSPSHVVTSIRTTPARAWLSASAAPSTSEFPSRPHPESASASVSSAGAVNRMCAGRIMSPPVLCLVIPHRKR